MVKVEFLGPIGKEPMELDITTLKELSEKLSQEAGMQEWLENCAVAVNDTLVSDPQQPLQDGDKITLLPPVCGG